MGSQSDLDQGGTSRIWDKQYLGPSVGWIQVPVRNILPITAAGTYAIDPSTSLITVNVAGPVTVILPTTLNPSSGGMGQPGLFVDNPITIVDIGGHANANPITIQPFSGSENILGLASIQITSNYGGYTLLPSAAQQGWSATAP
jgi:hypothetical protein